MGESWLVAGQARSRPLAATLAAAKAAARSAGVTRLAEVTWLDSLGLTTFQAVRPRGLCLSLTMGKGLTPRAAIVSALLEAIEMHAAEGLDPPDHCCSLGDFADAVCEAWSAGPRDPLGVDLDPSAQRRWLVGVDMAAGRQWPVPFDLVSLDYTRPALPDALPTTIGLASGNSMAEASVSALAELLEHDLEATWHGLPARARRASEIDLATIDDGLVLWTVRRIARAGRRVRLWSIGQDWGLAAFCCIITDRAGCDTDLPPASGTGCHANRTVAALRAILEAAQTRVMLISGARDDLTSADFRNAREDSIEIAFTTLSFGPGPMAWSKVPTSPDVAPETCLPKLLDVAIRRSPLPVIAVPLPQPHPEIHVTKIVAPGLLHLERAGRRAAVAHRPYEPVVRWPSTLARRRLLFVGPTLAGERLPAGIEACPPAVAGDLAALAEAPPEMVGLIDGCFETTPSVWHKEILDLLALGVTVLGAASLGALRAADLHASGMVGIGTIFEAYRSGAVRRDDAVMVLHAPAELDYRSLTLALVDAEAAILSTAIPATDKRLLQRIARTMSFRERTWPSILKAFTDRTGRPAPIAEAAFHDIPSLKRRDARTLVEAMAGPLPPRPALQAPPFTRYYRALLAQPPRLRAHPRE